MKSMRDLMETVLAEYGGGKGGKGGKGGIITKHSDAENNKSKGKRILMPQIVATVAGQLSWNRKVPVSKYPFKGAVGIAYPRVFTKSNVEFVLYGESEFYMIVAAKRRNASWNTVGNGSSKDPNSVTFFRIHVKGDVIFTDLATRVREFTQRYKKENANSGSGSGNGTIITGSYD